MGHQFLHLLLSIAVMANASPPAPHEHINEQVPETYASEDAIQNETLCPDMFTPIGDQCIYFASFMQEGRAAGKQVCHSLGGELAAIKTATQLQNIIAEIKQRELSHANFWIDGAFNGTSWNFTNEEPVPMGTPFWYATKEDARPNNDSTLVCVSINPDSGFLMINVACDEEHSPLCEHAPLTFNKPEEDQEEAEDPKDENIRCPAMFTSVANTCLAFITFFKGSWETAKQTCHSFTDKSSLLLPTDIELLREIYLFLHAEGLDGFDFWIGATDEGHEGVWKDTSGHIIEINAPFWGNSNNPDFIMEPDGNKSENCLALTSKGQHYFRDEDCSLEYNPLCEAPPLTT